MSEPSTYRELYDSLVANGKVNCTFEEWLARADTIESLLAEIESLLAKADIHAAGLNARTEAMLSKRIEEEYGDL